MENTNVIVPEESIEKLLGDSLIVTGRAGYGKTRTLKLVIDDLVNQSKKVCLIDFKNDYEELDELNQVKIVYDSLHQIDIEDSKCLYRIAFNANPLVTRKFHDMSFLNEIPHLGFDYLIIDEFNHLLDHSNNLTLSELLRKSNSENMKVIFSLQDLRSLAKDDRGEMLGVVNHLVFKERGIAVLGKAKEIVN